MLVLCLEMNGNNSNVAPRPGSARGPPATNAQKKKQQQKALRATSRIPYNPHGIRTRNGEFRTTQRFQQRAVNYWGQALKKGGGKIILYNCRTSDKTGPLSNMSPFGFTKKDGTVFPTLEHAYVHAKVKTFQHSCDPLLQNQVREVFEAERQLRLRPEELTPMAAKALGARVVPREWSDSDAWKYGGEALRLMHDLMLRKYRTNMNALAFLLETRFAYLAEGAPDKFWGLGIMFLPDGVTPAQSAIIEDVARHPGLNTQGILTMTVRETAWKAWARLLPPEVFPSRLRDSVPDQSAPVRPGDQYLPGFQPSRKRPSAAAEGVPAKQQREEPAPGAAPKTPEPTATATRAPLLPSPSSSPQGEGEKENAPSTSGTGPKRASLATRPQNPPSLFGPLPLFGQPCRVPPPVWSKWERPRK